MSLQTVWIELPQLPQTVPKASNSQANEGPQNVIQLKLHPSSLPTEASPTCIACYEGHLGKLVMFYHAKEGWGEGCLSEKCLFYYVVWIYKGFSF